MRAVKLEHVQSLSQDLCAQLAAVTGAPEDHFTFEFITSQFFAKGQATDATPFVEVLWFERTQEVQNQCARLITEALKKKGPYVDTVVVFQPLQKNSYYENGEHF